MSHQQEKWRQWHPLPNLRQKYRALYCRQAADIVEIELCDYECPLQKLSMQFDRDFDSYEKKGIHLQQPLMDDLRRRHGELFHQNWTFFMVNNSSYLQWLDKESRGIITHPLNRHFLFILQDAFIDVIAHELPPLAYFRKLSAYPYYHLVFL